MPDKSKHVHSKISSYLNEPSYRQRDVLSLKRLSSWPQNEIRIQLNENRALQPGFMVRDPEVVIQDSIICKVDWLTDVLCPSVKAALTLNIAKELIVKYKINEDDIGQVTQQVYQTLVNNDPKCLTDLGLEVKKLMKNKKIKKKIEKLALENLKRTYPDLKHKNKREHLMQAFIRIQTDIEQRSITHSLVCAYIVTNLPKYKAELRLSEKKTLSKGRNNDYTFLGAAGSGKSTVIRQFITEEERSNKVALSTDVYRGVFVPGTEAYELRETKQGFIKTQDTAYLIKDLVQAELMGLTSRPDLLIDCVTLEGWHKQLLQGNQQTYSAVAALDDVSLVPERAYKRALSPTSGPADRGRHVHTSALLEGHSKASTYLLSSIPSGVETEILDTNASSQNKLKKIAKISTKIGDEIVSIYDIKKFSSFLGKANINPEATRKGELYYNHKAKTHRFTYSDAYKAEQILKVAISNNIKNKPSFTLLLHGSDMVPYAKIKEHAGKLVLEVVDETLFSQALKSEGGKFLVEIVKQIVYEGLEESRKETFILGEAAAGEKAIQRIKAMQNILHTPRFL